MSSPTDSSPWRLEWNEGLSMFIPEIDAEHQHFIRLVNELNEAIAGRMGLEKVRHCMQAIVNDAVAHFAHEEALLGEWGYPAVGEHAEKHAQITQALRETMTRFEHDGTEFEWVEAGLQIKKALIEHLLTEDMKYRDFRLASGANAGGFPG